MFRSKLRWTWLLLTIILLAVAMPVSAATYNEANEANDNDLSDDPNAPTQIQLEVGDNRITETTMHGDLEFVTLNVPKDHTLTSIVLESYIAESDYYVFLGIQSGTRFKLINSLPATDTLLGWSYFGPEYSGNGVANLEEDSVPVGLNEPSGGGFTDQLPAGDYTIMLRQDGDPTTYTLNFILSTTTAVSTSSLTSTTVSHILPLIIVFAFLTVVTRRSILVVYKISRSDRN